ncbi:MAG: 30S ribosomal protein S6 [Phycisphaerae bacterium]|nr:30S ribosomal protein S6 [Phycisphaerae bacterium]
METAIKRLYEGLFLVDSAEAASDWDGVIGAVEKVLSRSECEVVTLEKWDERKLTYDINKKSRGTYILTYFNCDPLKIGAIERDVQLSEHIMRVMVLKTDKMSEEDIKRETPQAKAAREEAEAAVNAEAAEAQAAEKAAAAPVEEADPTEEADDEVSAEDAPSEEESNE